MAINKILFQPTLKVKKILFQPTLKVKKLEKDALCVKKKPKYSRKTLRNYAIVLAILLVIVFLFRNAFYINQESQRALEMRKNDLVRVTGPGLHFKLPFRKHIQYSIDIQRISFEDVSTESFDEYQFKSRIVLRYQIPENKIEYIHRNVPDYKKILEDLTQNAFKNKLDTVQMTNVSTKRQEIESDVQENIRQEVKQFLKINIRSFHFHYYQQPQKFLRTLADQRMVAEEKTWIEETKRWKNKQDSLREHVDAEAKALIEKAQPRVRVQNMEQVEATAKP